MGLIEVLQGYQEIPESEVNPEILKIAAKKIKGWEYKQIKAAERENRVQRVASHKLYPKMPSCTIKLKGKTFLYKIVSGATFGVGHGGIVGQATRYYRKLKN